MSRLIDAEALTEKLKEWLKDKETSRGRGTAEEIWCNDAEIDILDAIIEDISRMPTVEAKPIIHAKWVSSKIPGSMLSECSHCNFDCGAYSYEYCPICGAKMDGEENEIKKLEAEKERPAFERVEKGKKYYIVTAGSYNRVFVKEYIEEYMRFDKLNFENNNYFLTKERAEEVADKIKFLLKLERLHDIYCPNYKPNWNNEWESKFYIFYNIPYKKYQYSISYWTPHCLNIYFNSEETAEKVCEILNKEI